MEYDLDDLKIDDLEEAKDKFHISYKELKDKFMYMYFYSPQGYNSLENNSSFLENLKEDIRNKITGKIKYEDELLDLSTRCVALAREAKNLISILGFRETEIYQEMISLSESLEGEERDSALKVLGDRRLRLEQMKSSLSTNIVELDMTRYDVFKINPVEYRNSEMVSLDRDSNVKKIINEAKEKLNQYVSSPEDVLNISKSLQGLRYDVIPYLIEVKKNEELRELTLIKRLYSQVENLQKDNPNMTFEEALKTYDCADTLKLIETFRKYKEKATSELVTTVMLYNDLSSVESLDGFKYSCKANKDGTVTVIKESDDPQYKVNFSCPTSFFKSHTRFFDDLGDIKDEITFNDQGVVVSRDFKAVLQGILLEARQELDFSKFSDRCKSKLINIVEATLFKGDLGYSYQGRTLDKESSLGLNANLKALEFKDNVILNLNSESETELKRVYANLGASLGEVKSSLTLSEDLLKSNSKNSFSVANTALDVGFNESSLLQFQAEVAKKALNIDSKGVSVKETPVSANLKVGNKLSLFEKNFVNGESSSIIDTIKGLGDSEKRKNFKENFKKDVKFYGNLFDEMVKGAKLRPAENLLIETDNYSKVAYYDFHQTKLEQKLCKAFMKIAAIEQEIGFDKKKENELEAFSKRLEKDRGLSR